MSEFHYSVLETTHHQQRLVTVSCIGNGELIGIVSTIVEYSPRFRIIIFTVDKNYDRNHIGKRLLYHLACHILPTKKSPEMITIDEIGYDNGEWSEKFLRKIGFARIAYDRKKVVSWGVTIQHLLTIIE